ncbi:unnamed protein product [Gulo gulo]|uniref:Uncharacterized protein n=1 Tax=Gulo gulo TaxID=48420 RepID=A0A9X9M7Q1_GULGU|nr:unnamed protein product [Gulo gulo]
MRNQDYHSSMGILEKERLKCHYGPGWLTFIPMSSFTSIVCNHLG